MDNLTRDATIEKVKVDLRITHSALDADLNDQIESCLRDLESNAKLVSPDETDPLVLNAIKLWCRAFTTDDPTRAAMFLKCYQDLRATLSMNLAYITEVPPNEGGDGE